MPTPISSRRTSSCQVQDAANSNYVKPEYSNISRLINRTAVTARLLPRWLCLEAGSEVGIVDEVIEKLVPGLGRETGLAEHVSEFIYTVIG